MSYDGCVGTSRIRTCPHGNPGRTVSACSTDWIAIRDGECWLIDVSHNMDLTSPDLAKAQAALSRT
jgi:hypothetical protein